MRQRIAELVARLRAAGAPVGVGEVADACEAVALVGMERAPLKEALAATLVKDHALRPAFELAFEACFPVPSPIATGSAPGGGGGAGDRPGASTGSGGTAGASGRPSSLPPSAAASPGRSRGVTEPPEDARAPRRAREGAADAPFAPERPRPGGAARGARAGDERGDGRTEGEESPPGASDGASGAANRGGPAAGDEPAGASGERLARRAALARKAFRDLAPQEAAEVSDLARELAGRLRRRWSRRWRAARRGRLDLRATSRRAAARGGVPLELLRKSRRPARPDLLVLLDVSWSTRVASEMLLSLVLPSARFFRRIDILAYVDRCVPATLERGHLIPHAPLDAGAPSDFGAALASLRELGPRVRPETVLLVLGDGRNNRRPARAIEFARLAAHAGLVAWVVPEPQLRWGTGDSDLRLYARHVDALLEAPDLESLGRALEGLVRPRTRRRGVGLPPRAAL